LSDVLLALTLLEAPGRAGCVVLPAPRPPVPSPPAGCGTGPTAERSPHPLARPGHQHPNTTVIGTDRLAA